MRAFIFTLGLMMGLLGMQAQAQVDDDQVEQAELELAAKVAELLGSPAPTTVEQARALISTAPPGIVVASIRAVSASSPALAAVFGSVAVLNNTAVTVRAATNAAAAGVRAANATSDVEGAGGIPTVADIQATILEVFELVSDYEQIIDREVLEEIVSGAGLTT